MKRLEFRFYSLDEIAAATGKDKSHKNFKRDTERLLARKGYSYEWQDRKGVTILSRDTSAQRRLKKLLVTRLGMNSETNPVDFAYFIMALSWIEGFDSAPWATKLKMLNECFGLCTCESTLHRWATKLYQSGNATRFEKGALWKTITDEYGVKRQIRVDPDSTEYKLFCELRSITLRDIYRENAKAKDDGKEIPHKNPFGAMIQRLYSEFGHYYYSPTLVLNALGDDVEEITRLVHEIVEETNSE